MTSGKGSVLLGCNNSDTKSPSTARRKKRRKKRAHLWSPQARAAANGNSNTSGHATKGNQVQQKAQQKQKLKQGASRPGSEESLSTGVGNGAASVSDIASKGGTGAAVAHQHATTERGGSRNFVNLARDETPPPGAEIFSTELISGMSVPDSEQLSNYVLISDTWKPRWNEPVQVPNAAEKIPKCSYRPRETLIGDVREEDAEEKGKFVMPDALVEFVGHDEESAPKLSYDADAEDEKWIKEHNEKHEGSTCLSLKAFEEAMGMCEREVFVAISQCIHARSSLGLDFNDETACSVCNSSEAPEGNEIVFCDGCDIAVHQYCYGIETIPDGIWLCNRCAMGKNDAKCALCPIKEGAMKPTDKKGVWAHVSCGLWIPEIGFKNAELMEPICNIETISRSRLNLTCFLCREKVGACIQCDQYCCTKAFHVTCGFKHGLYLSLDESKDGGVRHVAKCDKHSVASTKTEILKQQQQEELREQLRLENVMSLFEAKFSKLLKFEHLGNVPGVDPAALLDIYNYWVGKRTERQQPLLREYQYVFIRPQRFIDAQLFGTVSVQAHIKKNLERARLITEAVKLREKLKLKLVHNLLREYEIRFALLDDCLSSSEGKDYTLADMPAQFSIDGNESICSGSFPWVFSTPPRKKRKYTHVPAISIEDKTKIPATPTNPSDPKDILPSPTSGPSVQKSPLRANYKNLHPELFGKFNFTPSPASKKKANHNLESDIDIPQDSVASLDAALPFAELNFSEIIQNTLNEDSNEGFSSFATNSATGGGQEEAALVKRSTRLRNKVM
eukprot:Nk52_evm4s212 gene=Nk52_evmTU4s212